jgi:hypothetical protein
MLPTAFGTEKPLQEETLRNGLVLSTVLVSVVLAGCGSGAGTAPEPSTSGGETPPAETTSAYPPRTGPVKSLDVSDQCSLVKPDQATSLGADQPQEPTQSSGKTGCDHIKGEAGGGFMVFVSADKSETMQKFADARKSKVQMSDIAGYPAAEIGDDRNCLLSVDVSDHGQLFFNTLVSDGQSVPCDLTKRFAEVALQNLPNA